MAALDQARTRARRIAAAPKRWGAATAKAGRDIVKAPSRLIRSRKGDSPAKEAAVPAGPAPDDGLLSRARSPSKRVILIAAGSLLLIGWIAWAVYVTSEHGATAGLGVVIAWPALLCLLAVIALPFVGIALLTRREGGDSGEAEAPEGESEDENADEERSNPSQVESSAG